MRDVGFLIWIVLLFVGVIGSIVSSVRKQAQREGSKIMAPRPQAAPAVRVPAAVAPSAPEARRGPARVRPVPRPAPEPFAYLEAHVAGGHAGHSAVRRLFGGRRDLVRAVIAAEVFGKPRGLADEYFNY